MADQPLISQLDHLVNPVEGDSATGINVKYEPEFQALEAEIGKLESIAGEKVDWDEVERLSIQILETKSKDLLVACYLAGALLETKGLDGLNAGLALVHKLSVAFWDDMFPPVKRLRGRQAAVNWVVERTVVLISGDNAPTPSSQSIMDLYGTVSDLDGFLSEQMADKAPVMTDLIRPLRNMKKSAEAEAKAAQATAAQVKPQQAVAPSQPEPVQSQTVAPAQSQPDPIPVQTPPKTSSSPQPKATSASLDISNSSLNNDLGSEGDAKKLVRQMQAAFTKLANFYTEKNPADPKSVRYSRFALWMAIDGLPPVKEGKTMLPPPAANVVNKIKTSFEEGDFTSVVNNADKLAAKLPYWFEGQRLISASYDQLGAEYSRKNEELKIMLRSFLERVPGILDLQYADGTPFVDDTTRLWINSTIMSSGHSGSAESVEDGDELQNVQAEATELASKGKIDEAVVVLQQHLFKSQSRRNEYRVRLMMGDMLLSSGNYLAAIPILKRVSNFVSESGIADWEPDFAKRSYGLLYQAFKKLEQNDGLSEENQRQMQSAYDALCWHDPGSALA